MILIISEPEDNSTNHVIDWLLYYKADFIRVSSETKIEIQYLNINTDEFELLIDGIQLTSKNISGYWYRRSTINVTPILNSEDIVSTLIAKQYKRDTTAALLQIINIIEKTVPNSLGGYFNHNINKLFQLSVAQKCGLKIPQSYILKNLKNITTESKYITKSLTPVLEPINDGFIMNYTNEIDTQYYTKSFGPTLIQEKINKKFEIRTFFLKGKMFSMAIFSQKNKQTETDFRRYDIKKPNRRVPIKLPKIEERKIIKFMDFFKLNTGSLDIIYTEDGEYVFLEVNPIGQFGMTSIPCNYYLEKKIADILVNNGK